MWSHQFHHNAYWQRTYPLTVATLPPTALVWHLIPKRNFQRDNRRRLRQERFHFDVFHFKKDASS
jgi:hypothetical protein